MTGNKHSDVGCVARSVNFGWGSAPLSELSIPSPQGTPSVRFSSADPHVSHGISREVDLILCGMQIVLSGSLATLIIICGLSPMHNPPMGLISHFRHALWTLG